jgi:hypothetical protein
MQLTVPASCCPNSETFVTEQAIAVGRWAIGVPESIELPVAAAASPSPLVLTPLPLAPVLLPASPVLATAPLALVPLSPPPLAPVLLPASPVLATAPLALVPLAPLPAPITAFPPQPTRARAARALHSRGIDLESERLTLARQARSEPSRNHANVQRPSKATAIWFEDHGTSWRKSRDAVRVPKLVQW